MDWAEILNSRPAWLVAVAVFLYMLPKILERLAPFVPPLARLMTANVERQDAVVHHRLDTEAVDQAQEYRIQNDLLAILKDSLERAWADRAETHEHMEEIGHAIEELRRALVRNNDVLTAHSINIAKLADEIEGFKVIGERVSSIGSWILESKQH